MKGRTRWTMQRFCKDCGKLTPCSRAKFNQAAAFYCTKCWDRGIPKPEEEAYRGKEADLAAALQTALS
jgi:hypothetical protein